MVATVYHLASIKRMCFVMTYLLVPTLSSLFFLFSLLFSLSLPLPSLSPLTRQRNNRCRYHSNSAVASLRRCSPKSTRYVSILHTLLLYFVFVWCGLSLTDHSKLLQYCVNDHTGSGLDNMLHTLCCISSCKPATDFWSKTLESLRLCLASL